MLLALWDEVPECCRFGFILGYHITLVDSTNASSVVTITTPYIFKVLADLKKFHVYNLSVAAFTSKGVSPEAFTSASTDQDGNVISHNFFFACIVL